jgi:hypothetical protein
MGIMGIGPVDTIQNPKKPLTKKEKKTVLEDEYHDEEYENKHEKYKYEKQIITNPIFSSKLSPPIPIPKPNPKIGYNPYSNKQKNAMNQRYNDLLRN